MWKQKLKVSLIPVRDFIWQRKLVLSLILIFGLAIVALFFFIVSYAITHLEDSGSLTLIFGWIIVTWFLIIAASLVGGMALRLYTHPMPVFRLRDFSRRAAMDLVRDFTLNAVDDRFGFPSGRFSTAPQRTTADVYVADENSTPFETNVIGIVAMIYAVPAEFGNIGIVVGIILAVLAAPFAFIFYLLEIVLRALLRSRVTVRITEAEDAREDVEVRFRLRGPSALIIQGNIRRAFSRPELPNRIRSMAGLMPGTEENPNELEV